MAIARQRYLPLSMGREAKYSPVLLCFEFKRVEQSLPDSYFCAEKEMQVWVLQLPLPRYRGSLVSLLYSGIWVPRRSSPPVLQNVKYFFKYHEIPKGL